jgi:hypothetical protein
MDENTKTQITKIVMDMRAQGMADSEIEDNLRSMDISNEDISVIIGKPVSIAPPVEEPVVDDSVERLHSSIGELHEKQDLQSSDLSSIRDDLSAIRSDLDEIKPLLSAIKHLNTSLIELNKKMLVKYGSQPRKKSKD